MENSGSFPDQYEILRRRYSERLVTDLAQILMGLKTLLGSWSNAAAREIAAQAHKVAGSAGSFGFARPGSYCGLLENLLRSIEKNGAVPGPDVLRQLRELFDLIEQSQTGIRIQAAAVVAEPGPIAATERLVYLYSSRSEDFETLLHPLQSFGYTTRFFDEPGLLEAAVGATRPGALLARVNLEDGADARLMRLIGMNTRLSSPVPVFFLSDSDGLAPRLRALHAGAAGFFAGPPDVGLLVDRLDELFGVHYEGDLRVLIVDDDPVLADFYRLVLEGDGMDVTVAAEPADFLGALGSANPDLVLMDFYLKDFLGTDLARVLGQHETFREVPVIFLSRESSKEIHFETLGSGADNFLTKPIHPAHLIMAVRSRARRSRDLRTRIYRDSLTGLLNHVAIKEELARALAGRPPALAAAMIDLDHFKKINDTLGHEAGDRVIKSLARMMKGTIRGRLGRYGGEEFLVIFPGETGERVYAQIETLRENFARIQYGSNQGHFSATFSSGMAVYPEHSEPGSLLRAADEALYEAKRRGRNRTVRAP